MNKKKIKKFSKASVYIASTIISFQATLGMILGYFLAKKFAGRKTGDQGKLRSLKFLIGNYNLHFHHWLLGLGIFVFSFFLDVSFSSNLFFYGGMAGVIVHGVFDYNDWYKVIAREKTIF